MALAFGALAASLALPLAGVSPCDLEFYEMTSVGRAEAAASTPGPTATPRETPLPGPTLPPVNTETSCYVHNLVDCAYTHWDGTTYFYRKIAIPFIAKQIEVPEIVVTPVVGR